MVGCGLESEVIDGALLLLLDFHFCTVGHRGSAFYVAAWGTALALQANVDSVAD